MPHEVRCLSRLVGGIIIICLPLADKLEMAINTLGVTVGILVALVIFDIGSKLGVAPCPDKMQEYSNALIVPMGWEGETEVEARQADLAADQTQLDLEKAVGRIW